MSLRLLETISNGMVEDVHINGELSKIVHNALSILKHTPNIVLHDACVAHNREMVQLSLKNGADIHSVINGCSVMGRAAKASPEFFEFLYSLGAKPRELLSCGILQTLSIVDVCKHHNFDALWYLCSIDPDSLIVQVGDATDGNEAYSLITLLLYERDKHICFSVQRIKMLYELVELGSNLYHLTAEPSKANCLLYRVLHKVCDSIDEREMLQLSHFAIFLTAYGLTTTFFNSPTTNFIYGDWPFIDEHNVAFLLHRIITYGHRYNAKRERIGQTLIIEADKIVRRARFDMIVYEATELCLALSILPALVLVEILDHMVSDCAAIVPLHMKWELVTRIKHFKPLDL